MSKSTFTDIDEQVKLKQIGKVSIDEWIIYNMTDDCLTQQQE